MNNMGRNQEASKELKRIEWLLEKSVRPAGEKEAPYQPPYGDVTALNTQRVIMDVVGKETLQMIAEEAIDLLETSVAVYEANGDYAFGMFSSGWCRFMDVASRRLCRTEDNREALRCGRWLCHENCWNDSAKRAVQSGTSADISCVGGIRLYAEPICAGGRVVGAINIGYGDPPKDPEKLKKLASAFGVDWKALEATAKSYDTRPKFIVDVAKKRLAVLARLIGEIVEKAEARKALEKARERGTYLNAILQAIRNVNQIIVRETDPEELIQQACAELTRTMGYPNAWIALMDERGAVTMTAASGFDGGFEVMEGALKSGRFPPCMKRALARDDLVIVKDPASECGECPLAGEKAGHGGMVHSVSFEGAACGVLSVSVPLAHAHDSEGQALFKEVAGDLGFALRKMEAEEALKRSERLLNETERISKVGGWEYDPAEKRITWTDEVYRIHGVSRGAYDPNKVNQNIQFYAPGDREIVDRAFSKAVNQGEAYDLELRFVSAKGDHLWVRTIGNPVFENGKVTKVVGNIMDITERREAQEALRDREERLELALFGGNLSTWDWNIQTGEVQFDERWAEMKGFSLDEIRPHVRGWEELVHPDDLPGVWEVINAHLEGETPFYKAEFRVHHKSGEWLWIQDRGKVIEWDAQGNPLRACGTNMDITERKKSESERERMEALLLKRNQFIEAILDHLPVGLAVNSIDEGKATYMNKMFQDIYGWPEEELEDIEGFFEKVFPDPEYREKMKARTLSDIQSGDPERMHWEGVEATGKDGRKKIVSAKNIPIYPQNFMISTVQDITESKRLQAQLEQAQKMEAVGNLAGGVAHDFNNKLGVIMGHAEMALLEMKPEDHQYAHIKEILEAAKRSADLTRQLLAFARKQTISPQVLDLNETVEGMLKMLRRLIGEDIDLSWQPDTNLWPVLMDAAQIDQMLANLCVNARDAIQGVGKITIATENAVLDEAYCARHAAFVPGEYVMLAVSDDGRGMDQEILVNVFEPFFTTKEVGEGTGLGLATVYGIVKQNQGFINVYSEPGKGSTFKIYVPRHEKDYGREVRDRRREVAGAQGETVLLVEDDPAILDVGKSLLKRLGYTVLTADGPGEAMKTAQNHRGGIHLLITDVIMPRMSGKDLAEQVAKIRPEVKTLFMSGYTANTIAHHGVLDQGVHFIEKPFSVHDLGRKVREVLDQGPPNLIRSGR